MDIFSSVVGRALTRLASVAVVASLMISAAGVGKAMAVDQLFGAAAPQFLTSEQAARIRDLRGSLVTQKLSLIRFDLGALWGDSVKMPLDSGTVTSSHRESLIRSASDFTWIGDLPQGSGLAIFVVRNGQITGSIQSGLDHYTVTPLGGGLHALIRLDQTKFPPDHPRAPPRGPGAPRASSPSTNALGAIDGGLVYIDVLVAYTSSARQAYGGDMSALAQLSIDSGNLALANSNNGVVLRLAGTMEVAYTESTFEQALSDLTNGSGVMAQVQSARNAAGADLASLFLGIGQYCGYGWINSSASTAFTTVNASCAVSNYSFIHELGHNFGGRHDPFVDPSNSPYPYGHGYVHGTAWRTVMAYSNQCGACPRLPYFSSPSILYEGVPMGTAATNDNARVLRERAASIAAFRSSSTSTYMLSLNAAPSAGGATSGAGAYAAGSSVSAIATPGAGYAFANWTENGSVVSTAASYTFQLNADRTLAANFTPATSSYTITLQGKPGAGGSVAGGGTYAADTLQAVTATAKKGYTFVNWTENSKVVSTSPNYAFTLTGNRNLVANFSKVGRLAASW